MDSVSPSIMPLHHVYTVGGDRNIDLTAWRSMDWRKGKVPDPRKKNNVLVAMPVHAPTVWLDPTCQHCLKLDAMLDGQSGAVDEHHLGFYKRYADKDDFHIKDRPFPHVFTTHAGVEELTPSAVVNMFAQMADLDIDVAMQIETQANMANVKKPVAMMAGGATCHTKS